MAEAATGAAKSPLEALKRKVGPLPLGVWLALGLGIWWYMRKQQAAASGTGAQQTGTQTTGYGTDPAGNTGYIDPSTGYVYGSAEDVAALQNEGLVGANSYNTGGSGDTSGTGGSATDTGSGSTGTTPAPGTGTGTTTPGSGGTGTGGTSTSAPPPASTSKNWKYPAPTGLAATNISDSGFGLHWNPVTGPAGQKPSTYTVATYQMNGKKVDQFNSGATTTKEYGSGGGGLHPGWQYRVNVWANGGPVAPPHASIVVTVKQKGAK